jgi:hypothetical protein
MRRSLKFIPWILPFLGILLGYGYAYVFFHGLLETWQFVGKPDENIARIIGIRERTFNLQPSTVSCHLQKVHQIATIVLAQKDDSQVELYENHR